jgi:hypothetical protein
MGSAFDLVVKFAVIGWVAAIVIGIAAPVWGMVWIWHHWRFHP